MTADPIRHQRSEGEVLISMGPLGLKRLREAHSAKTRIPAGSHEAILINTGGGLAGGDRFTFAITAEENARLTVTSQAAERVYRSLGPAADVEVKLDAQPNATLMWLPQETILFDGARLTRAYEIDLDATARFILADMVILGRTAMGETVRSLIWRDAWRLRRGGALVWADATRIEGDAAAALASPAAGAGACALATILYAAPDAAERLAPLREALAPVPGCEAAATAFEGLMVARIVAREGHLARAAVVRALGVLQCDALQGGALPRSWST